MNTAMAAVIGLWSVLWILFCAWVLVSEMRPRDDD